MVIVDRNFNRMTASILGRCTPVNCGFSSPNPVASLYFAFRLRWGVRDYVLRLESAMIEWLLHTASPLMARSMRRRICQSGRKGTMLKTLGAMRIVLAGACGAKVD
jgi:hypothetical protein